MRFLNLGSGNHFSSSPEWTNVDSRSFPGVLVHDLMKPLPFPDEEFEVVYQSDVLEHLPKRYAPIFIKGCCRVLKTGGIMRVAVPDLESVTRDYLSCLEIFEEYPGMASEEEYDWIVTELIDQMTRRRSGGEMLNFWRKKPMPALEFVLERVGSEPLGTMQGNTPPVPDVGYPLPGETDPLELGRFMLSGEVHQWMYDGFSLNRLLLSNGFSRTYSASATSSVIPDFQKYGLDVEPDGRVRKPDSLFMEAVK